MHSELYALLNAKQMWSSSTLDEINLAKLKSLLTNENCIHFRFLNFVVSDFHLQVRDREYVVYLAD